MATTTEFRILRLLLRRGRGFLTHHLTMDKGVQTNYQVITPSTFNAPLPEHVLVVGCQPETCEDFAETLSAPVAAAVPVAAKHVRELLAEVITPCSSAGVPVLHIAPPAGRERSRWTRVT